MSIEQQHSHGQTQKTQNKEYRPVINALYQLESMISGEAGRGQAAQTPETKPHVQGVNSSPKPFQSWGMEVQHSGKVRLSSQDVQGAVAGRRIEAGWQ